MSGNNVGNLGLMVFVGINEYGEEIIELIEPEIKLDMFYYSCANKFEIDFAFKYVGINMEKIMNGIIIFANGDECLGYKFIGGDFVKIFGLNGNLVKRHNKGGYSANRFARIAEESRHLYVVRVCDRLRELNLRTQNDLNSNQNNWIWGSDEIVQMIITQSPIKLKYGGFLEFNSKTILNKRYWLEFLSEKENYDDNYAEILEYLAINPDMLDFDPVNSHAMKYYMVKDEKKIFKINKFANTNTCTNSKQIPLDITSKYYAQLVMFDYIGVKYFNHSTQYDNLDDEN